MNPFSQKTEQGRDLQVQELEKTYLQHTAYHHFPGGRKKLAFIVNALEELKLRMSPAVLDVGCGNGQVSLPIASLGYDVTGIDIFAETIVEAKRNNVFPNAQFFHHNLCISQIDKKYDCAVCSEVLEHLPDPNPLMKAMHQALNSKGMLIITVPNGYGPREVLGRLENSLLRSGICNAGISGIRRVLGMHSREEKHQMHTCNHEQDHVQRFTPHSLRQLVENNGFEIKTWVGSFLVLSLFGKIQSGLGFWADVDSWLAEKLPLWAASGWYVICVKKEEKTATISASKTDTSRSQKPAASFPAETIPAQTAAPAPYLPKHSV